MTFKRLSERRWRRVRSFVLGSPDSFELNGIEDWMISQIAEGTKAA